ncbi:ATPase/histidine kinase/DNA gyrase B/HSP90 domain protein [Campylobacter rectus RM3267]|uniref:histidine kinase n=2 Tax=Campylobacter rectus TaxID=203 RepID=B9D2A7_CAMRE|nr:ATPase/histidine kinase/DNA gyrase B/HSP90 domain protein [Campylobacter rectus RM3267]
MFMSERSLVIVKILSLYLITSAIFLGYFFTNDYNMKKEALVSNEVKNLKEIKMGIYMKARMDGIGAVKNFTAEKNVKACIVSKSGEILYSDEDCAKFDGGDKDKSKEGGAIDSDGRVAIFEALQNMDENGADDLATAKIALSGKDIASELNLLRISTALNLFIILAILMIIAFYLSKTALAPLHAKITALNRFIKDSTHEINTPLSVILMSIETADKKSLSQRNLKRINNIETAAKTLSHIYEDLTYLSFGASRAAPKEELNFKEVLSERLEFFAPFFAKRALDLRINLKDALINANTYELKRAVDNLLSNAVKYTNSGGYVTVSLSKDELKISNSGEGLSKEQQDKIFERYTRFNEGQGGFGIGLNLVKRACENNAIVVTCESEPGKETTFTLRWRG